MATGIFIDFLLIMVFANVIFAGGLYFLRFLERKGFKRKG